MRTDSAGDLFNRDLARIHAATIETERPTCGVEVAHKGGEPPSVSGHPDRVEDEPDLAVLRWNEAFYRADPGDYLLTRLELLLLAGGRRRELADLLKQGVSFAGFTVGPEPADAIAAEPVAEESLEPFLTVESQQLLHHASETVLRLFVVHASRGQVPWVTLASERSFSAFKRLVSEEFVDSEPSARLVGYVCLGSKTAPDGTDPGEWNNAIAGITAFLRRFAVIFLDDAPIYNAIKHGLGVSAGDAIVMINGHQMGGGPSVDFPQSGEWEGDTRTWRLTTRWVDVGESLGLIRVATQMISSIWRVGRYRRIGGEAGGRLFYPVDLRPEELREPGRMPMRRFSIGDIVETRA